MPTPFICVNGNDVHSATGNGSLHKNRKQQAMTSSSHSSRVFSNRRKRNDRSSEMCRLLIATVVLLASGVVAENQMCKNGGTPTGIDRLPCFCTPSFNGKHCENRDVQSTSSSSQVIAQVFRGILDNIKGKAVSMSTAASADETTVQQTTPSGNSTQCMNGGVQIGVFCYCFAPYYGDRCQYGGNNTVSTTGSWFSQSTTGSGNSASVTSISPTIGASTTAPPGISTTPPVGNSTQCSNGGVLISQYCYCRDPYYGDHCQFGGSNATQVRFKRAIAQVFRGILEDVEEKDVSMSTTASGPVSQTTVQPTFPMTTVTASKNSTNFHPTFTTPASPTVTTASGTSTSTQCLNGGIQIGNVCYCRAPYFGSQCQYNGSESVRRVRSAKNRRHRALMEEAIEEAFEKIDNEDNQQ